MLLGCIVQILMLAYQQLSLVFVVISLYVRLVSSIHFDVGMTSTLSLSFSFSEGYNLNNLSLS